MGNQVPKEDVPIKLQIGDVVRAWIRGSKFRRYVNFTVKSVIDLTGDEQQIIASEKKVGSVRFIWNETYGFKEGSGHGLTFYFVKRPK